MFPYKAEVHRRLIDAASRGQTVTYTGLGFGRGWIGTYLYRIAHEEDTAGRPPLTSIVVRKDTGLPGPGLREAMTQIGYARPSETDEQLWRRATTEVFRYWRGKSAAEALSGWRPALGESPSTWPRMRR
jgi:hypothetical protein